MKQKILMLGLGLGWLAMGMVQADGLALVGTWWSPSEADATYGVGLQARKAYDTFYAEIRGTYFEDISEDDPLLKYELTVLPIEAGFGLQFLPSEKVELYGGGGGTYYFLDSNVGEIDDRVGYYLKVGCEVDMNESIALNFEAIWRDVEARVDDDEGLVDNSFNLDGVALSIGLVYLW